MKRLSALFRHSAVRSFLLFWGCCAVLACNSNTQTQTTEKTTSTSQTDTANGGKTALVDTADTTPFKPTGMTFPVLDALVYDKDFVSEMKSRLQLTDEELTKLKGAAQACVKDLDEHGDGTAYLSDAEAVAKRSEGQIKTILGSARANALQQLVAERYANGNISGLLPDKPNTIPTDTRVIVNAPAFRMDIFKSGELVKSYLVGIGQQKYPLPAGMRHAENIIFNPTWTPPNEPWVKGKFAPGKVVAAGSKDNPLGPVKIPIGAPSLIHGGKQPYKLGNYASHGCVGLTNDGIRDFTATLAQVLGSEGLTVDSVESYGKAKTRTKYQKLPQSVPVELRYETIVAEKGSLVIYRDVYTRGTNTVENARKVLAAYNLNYNDLPAGEKAALHAALETMNRDAAGKPIAEDLGPRPAGNSVAEASSPTDTSTSKKAKKAKKGPSKEMRVFISGLDGRGYPEAVVMVGRLEPKEDTAGK